MKFLLRSRLWSDNFAFRKVGDPENFFRDVGHWLGAEGYVFLAMDGETFGEHWAGYADFLKNFLESFRRHPDFRLVFPSFLAERFPAGERQIRPGTWSTNAEHYQKGIFFPLWNDPHNHKHEIYWKAIDLVRQLLRLKEDNLQKAKDSFDEAFYSCAPWWVSEWHDCPGFAEKVFSLLLDIILSAKNGLGEEIYEKMKMLKDEFRE